AGRSGVSTDSGWNWTPSTGSSRWRTAITSPSSQVAEISSSSGTRAAASEWYRPASNAGGRPAKRPTPSWCTGLALPWTSRRAKPISPPKASTIAWWPRQTPSGGSRGRLGSVDCGLERGELAQALVVLGRRLRVGDDPRARLEMRHAGGEHDRPDRDAGVKAKPRNGVADRPSVRPAAEALELGDQL